MKTVKEMSNAELIETLNVMEVIDSPEAKKLADEIKAEKARREAEQEAKRKAEEESKKAEEAKREAEAAKSEDELVEKQKSVLGKCYKKVFHDTDWLPSVHYTVYYKVIGVYDDKAVVSFVKVYNHSEMVSRAITFVNINDLLDKTEKYETITRKEFTEQYNLAKSSFDDIADVFKRAFAWL